jgi:hypothetical protein
MEKRNCIVPEHFKYILALKICCCTWNSSGLRGNEKAMHAAGTLGTKTMSPVEDLAGENWGG